MSWLSLVFGLIAAYLAVFLEAAFAGHKPRPVGFRFSLPGNMVMYLLMNLLIFGGATVAGERQNGQLRRMAAHPVSRGALVFGKVYGLMLLAGVQVAFYLLVGQFLFHVNLGDHLGAILLTLLVYAWGPRRWASSWDRSCGRRTRWWGCACWRVW